MKNERTLNILYGSQTGTAQYVAEMAGRQAERLHFNVTVSAMDDSIVSLYGNKYFLFICSTTGEGKEPLNMKKFWKFLLQKKLSNDKLKEAHFGVLGLGDSSYMKFNYPAKKLYKRLKQLGGMSLIKIGLADDQHDLGCDGIIIPWLEEWWRELLKLLPLPEGIVPIPWNVLLPSSYKIKWVNKDCAAEKFHPLYKILSNERITDHSYFQEVRIIRIETPDDHQPGDILMVLPYNSKEKVEEFLKLIELSPDLCFELELNHIRSTPLPLNFPCSILYCAQNYWDIQAIPKRYFFELLLQFTNDDMERERLQEFLSTEDQSLLFDYCYKPRRTIIEVLQDFPNSAHSIQKDYLFDLMPVIRPRSFSITSSSKVSPGISELLLLVVKYQTRIVEPRLGLCSNFLATRLPGDVITGWKEKGTFTFPWNSPVPLILIGPGTGCAPFRAVIQECHVTSMKWDTDIYLFFGCRYKEKDNYFDNEWKMLESKGKLHRFCAYSRDQAEKIYVQDLLKEQSYLIWNLIQFKNAFVYIAGSSKEMPQGVINAFIYIFEHEGFLSSEEAKIYLQTLEYHHRLQLETWS